MEFPFGQKLFFYLCSAEDLARDLPIIFITFCRTTKGRDKGPREEVVLPTKKKRRLGMSEPRTKMFKKRRDAKWEKIVKKLRVDDGFDKYRKEDIVKEVVNYMYVAKEKKWLVKHKFMLMSPLVFVVGSGDVLRNIWGFMYGHGP